MEVHRKPQGRLREKAKKGIIWVTISSFSTQVLGFLASVYLARLLGPRDFGLISLVGVVTALTNTFSEMGFGRAIIQRERIDPITADTAFTLNSVLSLILSVVVFLTSPLIAGYFNEPQLSVILKVLALNIILHAINVVPTNLLERDLAFRQKALAEVTPPVVYAIVAITCALLGFGVWSLVIGLLSSSFSRTLLLWHISRYRPSWKFDWEVAQSLWRYGQHLFYGSLLLFISANLDKVYVGRFISTTQVGLYGLALTIGNLPTDYIAKQFRRVLFPVFSRVKTNISNLQEAYLSGIRYIAYLSFPMSFGIFIVAPMAISLVYGNKWAPAVPLIRILSIYGLFRSIGNLTGPLFNGIGKPYIALRILILRVFLLAIFVFPLGSNLATSGVAIALTLSMTVSVLWSIHIVNKELDLSTKSYIRQIAPQFAAAGVMLLGINYLSTLHTESFLALGILIGSGIAIYVLVLWLIAGARLKQDIIDSSSPVLTGLRRYLQHSPKSEK